MRKTKEVVAAAAKRGMKLTERYVYVIRSADRAKAQRRAGPLKRGGTAEAEIRRAIAEIGLARARVVLEEVEGQFAGAS